jgi:hypothetical protein
LGISSLDLYISGKFKFTEKSLKFLRFPNRPPDPLPSLLLPRTRALLCPPLSPAQCPAFGRRYAAVAAPPPASPPFTRPSPPAPALFPFLAALSRVRHGVPSRPPAAMSSPPRSVPTLTSSPLLFCPTEPGDHSDAICISFPFAVHTLSSSCLRHPLLLSDEPRVTVDSHHRAPIAFTDPLASFPDPCLCFPAPSCTPILARARSPMTTVRRRFLLNVGNPLRALPHHHNPSISTTSTP